jgi:hypothetical protein
MKSSYFIHNYIFFVFIILQVLTKIPQHRALPAGIYLTKKPKHVAPSLVGIKSAHGEDGLDGRPVK